MKTNRNHTPKSGFKVPEDYFGNLEDRICQKLNGEESVLTSNKSGFITPKHYFEDLEEVILSRIEPEKPKVIHLFRREYLFYAAAVVAIFALFLGNFFKSGSDLPMGWDDIEVSAMEIYIDEGYEMGYFELNTADYPEFILNGDQIVNEEDFNAVNTDAALEYIDENSEDPLYILE